VTAATVVTIVGSLVSAYLKRRECEDSCTSVTDAGARK